MGRTKKPAGRSPPQPVIFRCLLMFLIPFKDFHEIVLFRIFNIFLCLPVIRLGDVMQVVPDYYLNLFRINIHKTGLYLALLILHIF